MFKIKSYSINRMNKILAFNNFIFSIIVILILFFILTLNFHLESYLLIFCIFSIILLEYLIEILLLYKKYYQVNKNANFTIDMNHNFVTYEDDKMEEIKIFFKNIKYINVNVVHAVQLSLQNFQYADIVYNNNDRLIITSLLVREIEKEFKDLGLKYNLIVKKYPNISSKY